MGPAKGCNLRYVLILKDGISSYTKLRPCDDVDSDTSATVIGKWITCFGGMGWLVTHHSSHSKASLMNNLADDPHLKHHFRAVYWPWANDTVERVCEEVLRISRALMLEWRLSVGMWPLIIDVVLRVLNHSSVECLRKNVDGKNKCLTEVFLGLKPSPPFAQLSSMRIYNDIKGID